MISNYLYTIGKYLPPAQRDDVLKEIEANLYDYLEENHGEVDYTNEQIESAIRLMGHPMKVAEAYMGTSRSLVSSQYIDTYWLIIKFVMISSAVGLTIANIFTLSDTSNFVELFFKLISQIWQTSLAIIGLITIIFAIISRYSQHEERVIDEQWSLNILENAPEPSQKVNLVEVIIETFFLCLGLVLLYQVFGFSIMLEFSDAVVIPILNMTQFSPFIFWLYLLLGSTLFLNIYLLIKKQWQVSTRAISLFLNVFSILLITKLVFTPNILNFSVIAESIDIEIETIRHWLLYSVYLALAVFNIIVSVDSIGHVRALFKMKISSTKGLHP